MIPACIIVMGVSGCGKSTIGSHLARELGCVFHDGDDYHPETNIAKMAAGIPLNDEDRQPWLERLRDLSTTALAHGDSLVIACSALKKRYRDILRVAGNHVRFLYLKGDATVILERMQTRGGHFMQPGLLQSQFDALEPPDEEPDVIAIPINAPLETVIQQALANLH